MSHDDEKIKEAKFFAENLIPRKVFQEPSPAKDAVEAGGFDETVAYEKAEHRLTLRNKAQIDNIDNYTIGLGAARFLLVSMARWQHKISFLAGYEHAKSEFSSQDYYDANKRLSGMNNELRARIAELEKELQWNRDLRDNLVKSNDELDRRLVLSEQAHKNSVSNLQCGLDSYQDFKVKYAAIKSERDQALARVRELEDGIKKIIDDGIDTSTDGGMDFVKALGKMEG